MDDQDTITPLQSATVRAALSAIVLNTVSLFSLVTGKAIDSDVIHRLTDAGVPMAVNALTIYFAYRAYKGRMNATQLIKKE